MIMKYPHVVSSVTPVQAKTLINSHDYSYLDVRTREEFSEGNVGGSVNIPLYFSITIEEQLNDDFIADIAAVFERDSLIVVACKSGARSLAACELMLNAGFSGVVNMRGGFFGLRCDKTGAVIDTGWLDYYL